MLNDFAFSKIDHDGMNIFIADSGVSCHMTSSLKGITDVVDINETITVGNGQAIKATKMGTMIGTVRTSDGMMRKVSLFECKYVPKLAPFNLFSITHALNRGFELGNDREKIENLH